MNKQKVLLVLKPAAPAVLLNCVTFLPNFTNQKAFLFHSTPVLLGHIRRPYYHASEGVFRRSQRRYKNFVRGFNNPVWKRILWQDPDEQYCSNGRVQDEYSYNTAYTSQNSGWSRQEYQGERSNGSWGSSNDTYWSSCNQRKQNENRQNYSKESDQSSIPEMISVRLALGLSASGPLTLDQVKHAYHACAMKWHPDHNQGLYKTIAEEKFKSCKAAC